jgi:Tfp pilus assembly protein FimT
LRNITPADCAHRHSGFSMIEASVAMLVLFIVAGFALTNITGTMPGLRANAALDMAVAQLRRGRELALAQRRIIEIKFLNGNQIQLIRNDVPNGTTILSTVTLDNKIEFRLFDGVPDTPDSFGKGLAVAFSGTAPWTFLSDGTLADVQANPVNGTVFMGLPEHPETARAVTILGATGRVRGYRWTGTSWIK